MLSLLLACKAPAPLDSAPPEDSPARVDTGAPAAPWPGLSPTPGWTAEVEGYGTGAGFGDFDGDGDLDLVVAYGNDMARGPLRLYLNEGGALDPVAAWRSEDEHYYGHLAVGDLDGDGRPDLAVSRFLGDGRFGDPGGVEVFLNRGGALPGRPDWEATGFYSFACALGDLDLDGDLDLAVAVGEAYRSAPDLSRVFANDGRGGFGEAPVWLEDRPRHGFDVAWVDLDGDGWLDLALANQGAPHAVYRNTGGALAATPAWEAEGEDARFEGNTLDFGDVDGDGWLDLAISDNDQLGGAGTVSLYCGPSLARCWESGDAPAMQSAVSLEDLDGDGLPELIAGAWWGSVRRYDNLGGALERQPAWQSDTRTVVEAFAWADLDGSHAATQTLEGRGLVALPGRPRVLGVEGGVAGDGYISGPGDWRAELLAPAPRDLAFSNWDRGVGDHVLLRD